RVTYVGAVRRLDAAMRDFDSAGIPFDPGPGAEPRRWTARHVAVMRELVAALTAVLDRRREWDGLRREWMPPH
ncbi:MAG TPA: hypothetical protein VFR67_03650, partial [Pilimelia sp.]|nr:hypothetical protein [Pilimelia sp.]